MATCNGTLCAIVAFTPTRPHWIRDAETAQGSAGTSMKVNTICGTVTCASKRGSILLTGTASGRGRNEEKSNEGGRVLYAGGTENWTSM
jgi:hypothetical protein